MSENSPYIISCNVKSRAPASKYPGSNQIGGTILKGHGADGLHFIRIRNRNRENDRPGSDDPIPKKRSDEPPKKKWTKPLLYPIKVNRKRPSGH